MREILFRGKRMDNGEWIEGDLVHSVYKIGDTCVGKFGWTLGMHQVDHYTVGQYTGLNDKNGKRIFEGDILSLRTGRPHVVRFEDGAFVLENTAIPMRFAIKFEVIGNIHDNPDFMEGAENGK